MGQWLVIFLLPLAAWSGWWVGMRKEARELRLSKSRTAYFEGLSFLLNDQTEEAIDVFLSMADVDRQTFDNQLTLGALFRKRGELDRALHLHSQLAVLERLDSPQKLAVDYELAEDYMHAGMFRQAQTLLESLAEQNYRCESVYAGLCRIYERTAQWKKAIEASERWQDGGYGSRETQIAHYYCELAAGCLKRGQVDAATKMLDAALASDKHCGRAYWMQADVSRQRGELVTAIHYYQSIAEQESNFLPEVLSILSECYESIGRKEEYLDWLLDKESTLSQVRLTLVVAETIREIKSKDAFHLLKKRVEETHNPLLLSAFLAHHPSEDMRELHEGFARGITPRTVYQCDECGFRQQRLIWHCPACYAWSSYQPLVELKWEQR